MRQNDTVSVKIFLRAVHPIFAIARREVNRLRGRFGSASGSRLTLVLTLIAAAGFAFLAFRTPPVIGEKMYRVGIVSGAKTIDDRRFDSIPMERADAQTLLARKLIDAYVDDKTVHVRGDERSQYTADALRRVLEQQELSRVRDSFPLEQGFPLRVELNYLDARGERANNTLTLANALPTAAPRSTAQSPNPSATVAAAAPNSDAAVETQLQRAEQDLLTQINLKNTANKEIIVPSLLTPPVPFVQIILAFLFILPVNFVSVFFTGSFMDEKMNRRLTILFSAPVSPIQIILGKMLPYVTFAIAATIVVAALTNAPIGLALAIFVPVILFIFAVYLMVPLLYRTYKDTTFISMLATTLLIGYLIFPAMFSGMNDLAFMSPLTLAVQMYRGEAFGAREYLFATLPMVLIFALAMYIGTRTLNEEFLMGYRPLLQKISEAMYLLLDLQRPALSIFVLSLALAPVVYLFQMVTFAVSLNLPLPVALLTTLLAAAVIQVAAQSIGIRMLLVNQRARGIKQIIGLAFLSALGMVLGQSLLLLIALQVLAQSALTRVLFGAAFSPGALAANFVTTALVCVLVFRFKVRYRIALLVGALLFVAFSVLLAGGLR